jgi:diadenosine tetraphosphate (Ap4A) HIT family hydrolase
MNDTERATHDWNEKASGHDCPFERTDSAALENFHLVAPLSASTLYLERNQCYRGYCVLIYKRRHVARVDQLTADEWLELAGDLHRAHSAIWQACAPEHMNVASLGNVVPHLHWHLIPRYVNDPRWGNPIWPTSVSDMPRVTLAEEEYREIADRIRAALTG